MPPAICFHVFLLLSVALLACGKTRSTSSVPPGFAEVEKAELLFLGVFHFDDQGLDTYKPKYRVDVLAPDRQQELESLTEQLAAFRPTHVAVEAEPSGQHRLDSLYAAFLQGGYTPGPNEIYQIGFRLAKRLGLPRVDAVDAPARTYWNDQQVQAKLDSLGVSMETLMKRIEQDPWAARYQELYAREDSLKTLRPLAEHLLYINAPERIRLGHGAYLVGSFKLGADLDYIGPDDATSWYNRNLRIFSNLQALTAAPDDRILLVIGAGHLPILRFLAESCPVHRLREVDEFVAP